MTSKVMWMVRAGQGGTLFDDFKESGIVKIGLPRIGDLSNLKSRSAIIEEMVSELASKGIDHLESKGTVESAIREILGE